MSFKSRLVTLFCCSVLELAALTGVPMRPDEIRNLMELLRRPKIVHTDPERTSDGDGRMPATTKAERSRKDADALHAEFESKGVSITRDVCDQPYGCRDFDVEDCNGYRLCFGQDIERD